MKSFLKALGMLALMSGSLLHGYAIVFDKNSPKPVIEGKEYPFTDLYVYEADSVEKAKEKHANYQRLQGLPTKVVEILEKGKGPSEVIAAALAAPTEGGSVAVQKGFYTVVSAGKAGIKAFDKPIAEGLGRWFRGGDHAKHEEVWRGNRGRGAEWKTDQTMYAIVTLSGNLFALNEPVRLPTRGITGFTLVPTGNKDVPYVAQFGSIYGAQYTPAETDTRNLKNAKELSKTSGQAAFDGQANKPAAPVTKPYGGFSLPK